MGGFPPIFFYRLRTLRYPLPVIAATAPHYLPVPVFSLVLRRFFLYVCLTSFLVQFDCLVRHRPVVLRLFLLGAILGAPGIFALISLLLTF